MDGTLEDAPSTECTAAIRSSRAFRIFFRPLLPQHSFIRIVKCLIPSELRSQTNVGLVSTAEGTTLEHRVMNAFSFASFDVLMYVLMYVLLYVRGGVATFSKGTQGGTRSKWTTLGL